MVCQHHHYLDPAGDSVSASEDDGKSRSVPTAGESLGRRRAARPAPMSLLCGHFTQSSEQIKRRGLFKSSYGKRKFESEETHDGMNPSRKERAE